MKRDDEEDDIDDFTLLSLYAQIAGAEVLAGRLRDRIKLAEIDMPVTVPRKVDDNDEEILAELGIKWTPTMARRAKK